MHLCYIYDRETVRVWQKYWYSDQFEVFERDEWEQAKKVMARLGVTFEEKDLCEE